jgi:hypothetical protein
MRYGIGGQQYFDNNGEPLSAGKLYFYETGTTTAKDTYSDSDETVANTNPVILDAAGRQGDIFFSGFAKIVIKDSDGAQIDVTDPIGAAAVDGAFVPWVTTVEYDLGDTVTDSSGDYFVSLTSGNTGHSPSINPTYWQQMLFTYVYNANTSYDLGDVCLSDNVLYVSLAGTNSGNTPGTSPTYWKPLNSNLWPDTTVKTATFTAEAGRRYLLNTAGGAFTMTLPSSPSVGDLVGFADYSGTFGTFTLTIGRNSQMIVGASSDLLCDVSNFFGTLQFTAGRGWTFV